MLILVTNLANSSHLKEKAHRLRNALCRNARASIDRILGNGVSMECALR